MMARRLQIWSLITLLTLVAAACGKSEPATLKGSSVVVDEKGDTVDVVNAKGKKPTSPLLSADIEGVRLDADGSRLDIRLIAGESPLYHLPKDPKEGPAWFMNIWTSPKSPDAPAYIVAIVRDGPAREENGQVLGWRLSVCKGTDVCDKPAASAILEITGTRIHATVPLSLLKGSGASIAWTMQSYWNDKVDPLTAWSDWVPNAARPAPGSTSYPDPATRAIFPAVRVPAKK